MHGVSDKSKSCCALPRIASLVATLRRNCLSSCICLQTKKCALRGTPHPTFPNASKILHLTDALLLMQAKQKGPTSLPTQAKAAKTPYHTTPDLQASILCPKRPTSLNRGTLILTPELPRPNYLSEGSKPALSYIHTYIPTYMQTTDLLQDFLFHTASSTQPTPLSPMQATRSKRV